MASELRVTTIANNAGTESVDTTYVINGSAKAWVNFNGTGTIAARDSLGLSSLGDDATGRYTVNLTNAMENADYATTTGIGQGYTQTSAGGVTDACVLGASTVSSFKIFSVNGSTQTDFERVIASSHGDLA